MKNLRNLFIILSAALFFTACEKEESLKLWNISGKVSMKDAEVEGVTTPFEGVKVYLFSFPFTIDTTTSWFSKEGIIDSTITDYNGLYNFQAVTPGDYLVYPQDSTKSYNFDWAESLDSVLLAKENLKTVYEINFTTLQTVPENYCNGCFDFYFDSRGSSKINSHEYDCAIVIYRKTRTWEAYWDWGPRVRWGDWYYSKVRSDDWTDPGSTVSKKYNVAKDASNTLYQYKDDFIIKFYIYHWTEVFPNPLYTLDISADDMNGYSNSDNKWCKFRVNWTAYNTVEVYRWYQLLLIHNK